MKRRNFYLRKYLVFCEATNWSEILTFSVKIDVQKWQSVCLEKIIKRKKNICDILVDFYSMTLKKMKRTYSWKIFNLYIIDRVSLLISLLWRNAHKWIYTIKIQVCE